MTMTIALGSESADSVDLSRGKLIFRTIDITASTNTVTYTDAAFVDSDPDTITSASNTFVTDGFLVGDIIVTGTDNNNATYTIDTGGVAAGTLTLVIGDTVTTEAAGAAIFSGGTGLSNANGESVAASVFGLSDIYFIGIMSSEFGFVLQWNRTSETLEVHGEATNTSGIVELREEANATNAGTYQLVIYGY